MISSRRRWVEGAEGGVEIIYLPAPPLQCCIIRWMLQNVYRYELYIGSLSAPSSPCSGIRFRSDISNTIKRQLDIDCDSCKRISYSEYVKGWKYYYNNSHHNHHHHHHLQQSALEWQTSTNMTFPFISLCHIPIHSYEIGGSLLVP